VRQLFSNQIITFGIVHYVSQLDTEIALHKPACLDSKSPMVMREDIRTVFVRLKNRRFLRKRSRATTRPKFKSPNKEIREKRSSKMVTVTVNLCIYAVVESVKRNADATRFYAQRPQNMILHVAKSLYRINPSDIIIKQQNQRKVHTINDGDRSLKSFNGQ
jgi:hypothetical protein